MAQRGSDRLVEFHLRDLRNRRDLRRLLEDAMIPELHRLGESRSSTRLRLARNDNPSFGSLGMTAAIGELGFGSFSGVLGALEHVFDRQREPPPAVPLRIELFST
jgi:hypothetical protein